MQRRGAQGLHYLGLNTGERINGSRTWLITQSISADANGPSKAWTMSGKPGQPGQSQQPKMQVENIQGEGEKSWAGAHTKLSTGRLQLRDYCKEISLKNVNTP